MTTAKPRPKAAPVTACSAAGNPELKYLTLIEEAGFEIVRRRKIKMARYRCLCGEEAVLSVYRVREGRVKSCGCLKKGVKLGRPRADGAEPVQTCKPYVPTTPGARHFVERHVQGDTIGTRPMPEGGISSLELI